MFTFAMNKIIDKKKKSTVSLPPVEESSPKDKILNGARFSYIDCRPPFSAAEIL